jgi:Tfp pilus assembly protein PilO
MAGALADFSRRPLQYKVLVFAGIGALLGLVYWQFVLSSLIKERDDAKADLDNQKLEQGRLRDQKKRYDDLVADEARLREEIEQNQRALPTESEMPAFFDTLSRKTSEAGIELVKREIKKDIIIDASAVGAAPPGTPPPAPPPAGTPPVAAASFIKVPVDIEVTGTFYQLKKFMASLRPKKANALPTDPDAVEEKDRIVTIEALAIVDPKVRNNEIVLTARFTAATFRAKPPDVIPGAPPPPKPPGPPPPAGAGGGANVPLNQPANTPVPTGATRNPDGLKTKTNAAMDASDVRAQKASESAGEKMERSPEADRPMGGKP